MALEHLLAALEREAAEQAQALIAAAQAECARITAASEERAAEYRRRALAPREAELRAEAERALAAARREARRAELDARARLLDRIFAGARELFPVTIAGEAYRRALPGFLAEALACVGPGPARVRCHPALTEAIRHALGNAGRGEVTVEPDPAVGSGFVLTTADGRVTVDHTLESRLARARPRLALEALRALGLEPMS
ncbi:MAG TPA: V-type ATP synthase subunit E [Gemmatimonadales bacterium]|nr:V-type ATP synthase subunit E [Gemmatimonadales bacterium]